MNEEIWEMKKDRDRLTVSEEIILELRRQNKILIEMNKKIEKAFKSDKKKVKTGPPSWPRS